MMKLNCFLLFVVFSSLCQATDLMPWFGKEYEVELRASVLYQNYHALAIPGKRTFKQKENNDLFGNFSAIYPFKRFCCEFEATAAHTRHQNFRWDNFRFTGRAQFLDEAEGDYVSGAAGLTITQPFARALHDVSSFHHGHIEGEATLSIGKEYKRRNPDLDIRQEPYRYRWWNIIGIGSSDIGSPWVREYAAFEYRLGCQELRGFLEVLWGTGMKNIRLRCFQGYGSIRHRSVDIGFRYSYDLDCGGMLILQYARRVYALNFPEKANFVLFEYHLPFSSQFPYSY